MNRIWIGIGLLALALSVWIVRARNAALTPAPAHADEHERAQPARAASTNLRMPVIQPAADVVHGRSTVDGMPIVHGPAAEIRAGRSTLDNMPLGQHKSTDNPND